MLVYKETHIRSVAKAISWRFSGTLATSVIVYLFTGKMSVALWVGGIEVVSKLGLYFAHERLWDRIHLGKRSLTPTVLWLTGLSGSGKSTIANSVYDALKAKGLNVERLDGDTVRNLFPATGFSKEDRDEHIKRVGYLASRLESNGVFVVCSFISPYRDSRAFVRELCKNFVEIYLSTPLEVCEERDVKGLYAKVRRGEIKNFTGVDDPYEAPTAPDIEINTAKVPVERATRNILAHIKRNI